MSILAAIFGWTKLPQWALELGVITALAIGFGLYHHHVYATGILAQQQADRTASAKVVAQAQAETIASQRAANAAQDAYHAEIARNAADAAAHPFGSVRLCDDADHSGSGVPEAGATVSGTQNAAAAAGGIQQVPAGNSDVRPGSGPDIAGLLSALGRRADEVSAQLREYQHR